MKPAIEVTLIIWPVRLSRIFGSTAFIIATAIILIVMVLPAVRKRRGEITG